MSDVIAQFMAAAAAETTEQAKPGPAVIKVGDPVIGWNWSKDVVWGGPGAGDPRVETCEISFRGPSTLHCPVDRVAPEATELADRKDPRIEVVHHRGNKTRTRAYWLAGDWCLTLPGGLTDWFKTKRDAVDTAVRRLAIIDFHAASPQPTADGGQR